MRKDKAFRIVLILLAVVAVVIVTATYKKNSIPSVMTLPFNLVRYQEKEGVDILIINTEDDYVNFAESTYHGHDYFGKTVILNADMDFGEIESISDTKHKNMFPSNFRGLFDGKGHRITNFVVVSNYGAGLFSNLQGTIANLQILEGLVQGGERAGAFADIVTDAKLVNCCAYTDVAGDTVLGLYGAGTCEMENCVSNYNYTTYNPQVLNRNLPNMNRALRTCVENYSLWEANSENKPVLSVECAPQRILMDYDNDMSMEIFYSEDENMYICPVPNGFAMKNANPVVRFLYENGDQEYPLALVDDAYWLDWGGNIYQVQMIDGGDIPSICLELSDYEGFERMRESKFVEFNGTARVFDEDGKQILREGVEKMTSRGHSSFIYSDKVGFALEFSRAIDLFGMGRDLHWVLLPASRDNSFLSYVVNCDLANAVGLGEGPKQSPVHVYINGKYIGMYILSERIEIDDNRLNLSKRITLNNERSFIVELFNRRLEDETPYNFIQTKYGNYILRYPKEPTVSQENAIIEYMDRVEDAINLLGEPDEYGMTYMDYIDMPSFSKQWLMLYLEAEKSLASSMYFYRDMDSKGDKKLYAIRPWDVEHSFCEDYIEYHKDVFYDEVRGLDLFQQGLLNHKPKDYPQYMIRLYDNDFFMQEVKKHWNEEFLPAINMALDDNTGYVEGGLSSLGYYADRYRTASILDGKMDSNRIDDKAELIRRYFTERAAMITEELEAY